MFNLYIISMQQEWNQSFEIPQNNGKYQIRDAATKSPYADVQYSLNFGLEETLMGTSFEENLAEDHANAIWKASIIFLRNSVKTVFDETKGFNDVNLFQSLTDQKEPMHEQTQIVYHISKNSILTVDQKRKLILATKQMKDFKKLLEHSSKLFCEEIFEELILIFYEAWEKYLIFKQTTKLSPEICKLLGPSYVDIDKAKNMMTRNYYLHETENKIILKADEIADQIAGCYFISTKLRYLNLKEAITSASQSNRIRKQFEAFIQIIVRGVYLCLQGCFFHPNGQNNMNASFSQSLIKQELNDGLNNQARKRRKQ